MRHAVYVTIIKVTGIHLKKNKKALTKKIVKRKRTAR